MKGDEKEKKEISETKREMTNREKSDLAQE